MLSSLLNAVRFNLLETGYDIGLNWLGKIVRAIIDGVGIVGVGIIVFTLVLKAITLPLDIYQRVKMRKQTLIMRQMQPELEKLQKQYANDKTTYNQKMMELYKKNGYSMLGACLPMIVSLVILIVAFSAFRLYSNYANLKMYVDMSAVYNDAVIEYSVKGVEFEELNHPYEEGWSWTDTETGITYTMSEVEGVKTLTVKSTDAEKFLYYTVNLDAEAPYSYYIDTERLYSYLSEKPKYEVDESGNQIVGENGNPVLTREGRAKLAIDEAQSDGARDAACSEYVIEIGATAAADWYRQSGNSPKFLWIKNVWYPDVSYNHPVAEYKTFINQFGNREVTYADGSEKPLSTVFQETQYNNLTSQLEREKDQANGYFILIVLSIGFMVLSQFITMKSQKESNKYQTVDGQGAKTQKVMLVMMPLIYAIFAFMYSAAFSIYMTMSSILAIIVTLVSNLIIGRIFRKKEEELFRAKHTRTVPWKTAENDKKNNNRKGKK